MPSLLAEFAGGIALLLFSLAMIRTGIQRACGGEIRRLLAAGTRNRLSAFGAGMVAAALLQSSTATALMATSFVGRGMLPVATGLAILLGADLGSTLAAQLLSLDVHELGPLLLAGGTAAFLGARNRRVVEAGRIAVGMGLLLASLAMIVGASLSLRDASWMGALAGTLATEPLVAVLAGAALAWIAHSSLSVVLLILSLASMGTLPLPAALALVIGANIGGTFPALALTTAEPPAARRLPLGNLLFRGIGAAAAVLALPWLPDLLPGADDARRIVNFHTGFNLALAVAFLGLTGPVARLCARLLPDRPPTGQPGTPRYLDRTAVATPPVALAFAAREALRMGDIVADMLDKSFLVLRDDDGRLLEEVERMDNDVDRLNEAIKLYLARAGREGLDEHERRRFEEVVTFTTNLEHIGDIIVHNMMGLAAKKIRNRLAFSDAGLRDIRSLHERLASNLQLALGVFLSRDVKAARRLVAEKDEFRYLERAAVRSHLDRLRSGRLESIETSALHLDMLRDLKRIHAHVASAAHPILEAAGELNRSRLKPAEPISGAQ